MTRPPSPGGLRRGFVRLALLLLTAPLSAAQSDLGGADAMFPLLQDPAGARSISLGGAFEAIGEGPEGAHYNPAASAFAQGLEASLHHDAWLASTSRESLQMSTPAGERGGLSGFGTYVSYPSVELRDSQGRLLGGAQPYDWGVGLAGGWRAWDRVALGAGVQALRQDLPGMSLRGFQAQAGLLARPLDTLNVALVLRNRPLRDQDGERRGFVSNVGAALRLGSRQPFTGALSVALDPEAPAQLHLGVEQGLGPASSQLALRGGYTAYFPAYNLGSGHGLALGAGMAFDRLHVDYACQLFGAFGMTQQVSLSWRQPTRTVAEASAAAKPAPAPAPAAAVAAQPLPATQLEAPPPALALDPGTEAATRTTLAVLDPLVARGQAHADAGHWDEARQDFYAAIQAHGDDLSAWLALARLEQRAGRQMQAQAAWAEVLRLDPQNTEAIAQFQP